MNNPKHKWWKVFLYLVFNFFFLCVKLCVFFLVHLKKKAKIQKVNPRKLYVKQWILVQQNVTTLWQYLYYFITVYSILTYKELIAQ